MMVLMGKDVAFWRECFGSRGGLLDRPGWPGSVSVLSGCPGWPGSVGEINWCAPVR